MPATVRAHVSHSSGKTPVQDIDPRDSMRRLPSFLQLPLTLFTGKPHSGQRSFHLSAMYHLMGGFTHLVAGLAVGAAGWSLGGAWLPLVLAGWAMTLHGMRNLRMMVYHQCAHRNMF